ncbi:LytR C-terminal domain-containing protein [Streptomyces sp. NBC_01262]|uniref:LytR C-terminal domain-containing protein n=1 Tax=Streptomyces sp. NBC_01262 TaxID=2903803 RepID=UPI002E34AB67|nr:LytR C-terminal domain-containing protein [Streptomyces sp. NBC_01262]
MSMLTPPGMGGKYRITGNQYPRMRRPRNRGRIVAAVLATVVVVGLIGYGTLQLIDVFGGGGKDPASIAQAAAAKKRECEAASAKASAAAASAAALPLVTKLPETGQVTINVYNATAKSGLAKDTADALAARGFKIGTFGNAPPEYDRKVKQPALLVGGTKAAAALQVVGAQLTGTVTKIDAKRSGAVVDLMIGNAFKKLTAEKAAAKTLKTLKARAAQAKASPSPAPSAGTAKSC